MRARLIRIGNSKGVRLPKTVIQQARLTDNLDIRVEGNAVIISNAARKRVRWEEDAKACAALEDEKDFAAWGSTIADGIWR